MNSTTYGIVGKSSKLRFSTDASKYTSVGYYGRRVRSPMSDHVRVVCNRPNTECTMCCTDDVPVYSCPHGQNCKVLYCVNCVEYNASISDTCLCSVCGYRFSLADMHYMFSGDRDKLLNSSLYESKLKEYTSIYDKYLPNDAKRVNMAKRICDVFGISLDSYDISMLLTTDDKIIRQYYISDVDHVIQDAWRDLLNVMKETKTVDRCKDCNYDIVEVKHQRIGSGDYITNDCIQCNNRLCSKCGTVYDRTNQIHRCSRNDRDSYKAICKDSRKCPNCFVHVYRSIGCDDMWCTECKTSFNWVTGQVSSVYRHNPEQSDFLVKLYDDINLRQPGDYHLVTQDNEFDLKVEHNNRVLIRCSTRYNDSTEMLEKAVLSNILHHLTDVTHKLHAFDVYLQKEFVIDPSKYTLIRTKYLTSTTTGNKDQALNHYNKQMKDEASETFTKRYICNSIQKLIAEIYKIFKRYSDPDYVEYNDKNYSTEQLYIDYCRLIRTYAERIDRTCSSIGEYKYDLYHELFSYRLSHTHSYYNKETGVIIPYKYTINNPHVNEKIPSSILESIRLS